MAAQPSVHRAKGDRLIRASVFPVCDNDKLVKNNFDFKSQRGTTACSSLTSKRFQSKISR